MEFLTVHLSKASSAPFISLLRERGIQYRERVRKADQIYAAADLIQVLKESGPWAAGGAYVLAEVIVAYIKAKHGRKVTVTNQTGTTVIVENLTAHEVAPLLEKATSMIVQEENLPKS